jgi:hypothetical protein
MRAGRPDLLAVDDPVVTGADRAGAQTGQIRRTAAFGMAATPLLELG